ncbi:MAG: S-formylglutathione hydrolase [Marivibrio sp.]|uniref:S-formylglutathione hydrolase n=1 Tax=Marivibrio sp. TaxID=2039719 RepID=UPI0032EBFF72
MTFETISENKCFGGIQAVYRHESRETGTAMRVSVYHPPEGLEGPPPVLYWLSGLTCTEENFTVKAGAQRWAAEYGIAVVAPDTSPRGEGVPDEDAYDFGSGAGFYVDATVAPWDRNYRMYSYIADELPTLAEREFGFDGARRGIFGHSMGGHGALTIALKHPDRFKSVSAFAPIAAPATVPWGQKALKGYLGSDEAAWADYDSCKLVEARGWPSDILIDQGDADQFLTEQLRPELFQEACNRAGVDLELRLQQGYDHSYFFIATFMGEHFAWHAERLGV